MLGRVLGALGQRAAAGKRTRSPGLRRSALHLLSPQSAREREQRDSNLRPAADVLRSPINHPPGINGIVEGAAKRR